MVSEGSGAPVGHWPKAKATRANQPKQAKRPPQGRFAPIEVAERRGKRCPGGALAEGQSDPSESTETSETPAPRAVRAD